MLLSELDRPAACLFLPAITFLEPVPWVNAQAPA